jgi:hypothetical protein
VCCDECGDQGCCTLGGNLPGVNQLVWFPLPDAMQERLLRATGKLAEIDNRRPIAVYDVLDRAFTVTAVRHLNQRVGRRDRAVLGHTPWWTPAATWKAIAQGRVQRASVYSGLSTGNDPR